MTFLEHFEELRKRVFYSVIALAVGATVAYFFASRLLDLLTRPVPSLVFLAPAEAFVVQLKVALVAGALLAAPVIFYQFWRFVRPAMLEHEARYIALAVVFSTLFFAGGLGFAYFVMVPFAMRFLLGFETDKLQAMISIERYVTAVAGFMFAAGAIFQLPVVMFFLTKLGILKPGTLLRNQRIAIVAIVIVAAILSPPDVFSQFLMAVPLFVLYELGVLGSFLAYRSRQARSQSQG